MVESDPLAMLLASISGKISQQDAHRLNEQLKAYPAFPLLHYLKAKSLNDEESIFRASIYSSHRPLLKKYLSGELILPEQYIEEGISMSASQTPSPLAIQPSVDSMQFSIQFSDESTDPVHPPMRLFSIHEGLEATPVSSGKEETNEPAPAFDSEKLIDQFLKKDFTRKKRQLSELQPASTTTDPGYASSSIEADDDLVSETLAGLFLRQKNYGEAIRVYEKLSLRLPEKSAYFDAQIQKIRREQ